MTPLLETLDSPAPLPRVGRELIDAIERAHIVGRGGASFPAATKWLAVAERSHGNAVIVVNGAEGEPQSKKDRALMTARPHLILDGAFLAARALRANRIVLYIGERHDAARNAMFRALHQRTEPERSRVGFAAAPARYVAGAEAAANHFINDGVATPTNVPPYPFERGVGGAPTLVQNVETLAYVALVARGASWSEVGTEIGQLIGPTGFVALSRLDQGALMSLHGEPVDTTQYLVGNPLIARRIIGLNRTAALHAPFPLAIYGDDQGVHVAYTQPSSSFGSLGSADIDLIAKELDAMILGTVEQVCRT